MAEVELGSGRFPHHDPGSVDQARLALLSVFEDHKHAVEQLRLSEAAARESEAKALKASERLRNIIETSTDIICSVSKDGIFLEVSENCTKIWGVPSEDVVGKSFRDFISVDDYGNHLINFSKNQHSGNRIFRNYYIKSDTSLVPMSWSVSWSEEEEAYNCIGRDMTEYNAMEDIIRNAKHMESIGQLTGGLAHDFNNLLTIIIANSEILADDLENTDQRRLANMIFQAAERGAELTSQLLAFARRQPLTPCPFDVNELVDFSIPLIRQALGGGIEVSIKMPDKLKLAFADRTQTELAILNLCINARDAMDGVGTLVIETAGATVPGDNPRLNSDALPGDYVSISVSDTGSGIDPDIMERIFEPFFTTKEAGIGSGLGLSMLYGFVRQSKGVVNVASEMGKGSTFTIYLPATDIANEVVQVKNYLDNNISDLMKNVLIVEDHDLVMECAIDIFEGFGCNVYMAGSGPEAITILEGVDKIDLVFTDIVMPGGVNGWDLGKIIAERWPDIPVLFTSGYTDTLSQGRPPIPGVELLQKPYSRRELAEKVGEIFRLSP